METKPSWIKAEYDKKSTDEMRNLLDTLKLNTVCNEAVCPNRGECWRKRTATFLILGAHCTRHCRFCKVTQAPPEPVDANEPERIAEAVKRLDLRHAVITSVTRDDLPDGGAANFAAVTRAVKAFCPDTTVELLIPDLKGDETALKTVLYAKPDILGHNLETVPRLYGEVRPEADYQRSLDVLKNVKVYSGTIISKTGIMLGLGETRDEVIRLMRDVAAVGCDILTIGQYLRPSKAHLPVAEYIRPDVFAEHAVIGREIGIKYVYSAPLVRSSYNAADIFDEIRR